MTQHQYDVVIVGSGAGGGMAAYVLTRRGLNVLLIEAGRNYDPFSETPMFQVEADAPLNGAPSPDKPNGFYDATIDGGWEIKGEPYTVADGSRFQWWRSRMLGGRTNHWDRMTLRYGPDDFRTYSQDGVGVDWPISYEDLAPHYDKVERLIGVFGAAESIENSPDSPSGLLLPPPPMRVHERWVQMALDRRLGLRTVPMHAAILTQPFNGRPACLYATDCRRGCSIRANFQSTTVLLPPALATGHLELRTRAMAYQVSLDKHGRASGVNYIDTSTTARHFARARAVVLAASAGETARLLLNSQSSLFHNGLANSSGQVGRNLTNSICVVVGGDIPALQGLPPYNDDGASSPHAYIPWWGHDDKRAGRLNFPSEYLVLPSGGRRMPSVADFGQLPAPQGKPLYGQALRDRLRHDYGSRLNLISLGGMIPNAGSFCEIDPTIKDRWGIPVLRFHWKLGAHELAQTHHAAQSLSNMILALGGSTPTVLASTANGLFVHHEVGTVRMGGSAAVSVLNSFGQAWDVRNLYVADGASFAGHAGKFPTETIMALAWRACDHLADSLVRRDI